MSVPTNFLSFLPVVWMVIDNACSETAGPVIFVPRWLVRHQSCLSGPSRGALPRACLLILFATQRPGYKHRCFLSDIVTYYLSNFLVRNWIVKWETFYIYLIIVIHTWLPNVWFLARSWAYRIHTRARARAHTHRVYPVWSLIVQQL